MTDENHKYYPPDLKEEEIIEIYKREWTRDFHYRLQLGMESIAGYGTNNHAIQSLIIELPYIFKEYNIKSILDAPCGDYFVMKNVNMEDINYIGIDIVSEQIELNKLMYPGIDFRCINMFTDTIPKSDLVFCRDIFIHLSNTNIKKFIKSCISSQCSYLMSSTYLKVEENEELGGVLGCRVINLEKPPFNFPQPLKIITEPDLDKSMAVWKFSDLEKVI